jgi:hypothetical protein
MRSFDPFNRVIEALTQTGPISGGRANVTGNVQNIKAYLAR